MKVRINILLTVFAFSLVLLSCSSGSGPAVTFSISDHDFGSVDIDESRKIDIVISNKKNVAVTLTKFTMSTYEFLVISGGTPNTRIQPKTDHTITVQFSPKLPGGLKSGFLKIEYNFGYEALYKEITFRGTSVPVPKIQISPTVYDFQDVVVSYSKSKEFLISNTGSMTLSINSLMITGIDASEFSIISGTVGPIAYQQSMKVKIEFTPTTAGNKSAVLQIDSNAKNVFGTLDVALSGKGYDVPEWSITPVSPYDFGLVAKGDKVSKVFTIKNIGAADMNITQISIAGDYSIIAGGTLPIKIAPNATHDIEIEFAPSKLGVIAKTIAFVSETLTSPDTYSLTGEGFRGLPFEDDFESVSKGQLPTDWKVTRGPTSTTSANNTWQVQDSSHPTANQTGGSGKFVTADSEVFFTYYFEDYLTTPAIDCSTYTTGSVRLEFDGYFETFYSNGNDECAVEVYDGSIWHRLDFWNTDWNSSGEHKSYNITSYALGNSDLKVRFYYHTKFQFMKFFQIDNLKITRN